MAAGPRDRALIDTLEALETSAFHGNVWRVAREGRDPTLFFGGGNRWDDGSFEVLYTSCERAGALSEMRFHISRGQPIMPSRTRYRLHELNVRVNGLVDLTDPKLLERTGIDMRNYGRLPYLERSGEYEACQRVAEAVHFLGSDHPSSPSAILVPSARHDSNNLVLFADHVAPEAIGHVGDHGVIDWDKS